MKTVSLNNLLYEEVIMLQDILIMLSDSEFAANLVADEREIFDDLYSKIINS